MVRYAVPASWLLAAGLLATSVGHHGVRAAADPVGASAKNQASSVDVADNSQVDSSVWSLPEAIAKATGREPIAQWKEYLFKDPFGEKDAVGPTAAIFPLREPSQNGGYQVNWKGGNAGGGSVRGSKVWWPSITCPYGGSMDVDYYGKEKCIGVGHGICKDGWQFGIRHHVDNTYLMLWREDDPMNPVYKWFPGATSLCIGEQFPNVAYLRVVYEDCLYYLIGPSAGSADHLVRLKIVDDNQRYRPDDVIVKFRDGPGDQNALWQIFANGFSQTSPDALWYPIPCDTEGPSSSPSSAPTISMEPSSSPSASPSSSPSASPSASPSSSPSGSPSSSPSSMPSSFPSAPPTSAPSTLPSSSPTSEPSSSPSSAPTSTPSSEPSISSQPTAASCLPSPTMNIGTNAGGRLTFTLTSMPLASFYVELRTFVRGDFGQPSEFASFSWINGTEPLPPPANPDNFIGINNGGNGVDCDPAYHQEAFAIPVETYNAWVQEGTGTIQIFMQTTDDVNICDPHAEAFIQIQVDEGCGTFSNAPSISPSSTPSNVPSISLAPSSSLKPSSKPSISFQPSGEPSISSQPTAASCLPSPTMDIGTTPGGSLTFTLTSMPLASFYVELRTFVRGDFAANSEYADFFWVNGTEPLPPPANQGNFIGRNGGGGDCDPNYFQQTFVVSIDTYNAWVLEGNGTIPIFMDTPNSVNICDLYAEAYIQFQVDEGCGAFSNAPSSSPSAAPSELPTVSQSPSSSPAPSMSPSVSLAPSTSPSDTPSMMPSISLEPSASPSSTPSMSPSISFQPSGEPSTSSQPTAASCLPSPTMDIGTTPGGSLTFTLTSMPLASFYVELRTFIRGDFDGNSEYADFFWRNNTSVQESLVGRNNGGEECGTAFLEETFIIPIDTYNAWVLEGNGTIPIVFDASGDVDFCDPYAEAYIQFQVDDGCGAFSFAPSSQPTKSPQPSASFAPSSSPSAAPSELPTVSQSPSDTPSDTPSSTPSLSVEPSASPRPSSSPSVSSAPTIDYDFAYMRSESGEPWSSQTNVDHMNAVFGVGSWNLLFFETFDANNIDSYNFIFMDGSDRGAIELNTFLNSSLPLIEAWVANGGRLFLNAAPNEGGEINFGFGGVTNSRNNFVRRSFSPNPSHPIFSGSFQPIGAEWTGTSFAHSILTGGGISPILVEGSDQSRVVLADLDYQNGYVMFGGLTTTNFHSPQPEASNLRRSILEYTAGVNATGVASRAEATAADQSKANCWINSTHYDWSCENGGKNAEGLLVIANENEDGGEESDADTGDE